MNVFPALVLMVGAAVAHAQSTEIMRLDVQPGSKLWIEGGSNLHDWSCRASTFEALVDGTPAPSHGLRDDPAGLARTVQRVSVKVAVRNLRCGNSRMDRDLYRALKADDPSTPSYIFGIFNASPGSARQDSTLDTDGTIGVAGVQRGVNVCIRMERLADGMVKSRGSVPLLMTDFGVKPPTGLFGLVRSHNEVVVRFELIIARRPSG